MLRKNEVGRIKAEIVRVAQTLPYLELVILFGSAATGRLTPHSDVDIAVAGEKILSFEERIRAMLAFCKVLEREVDIVDMNTVTGPILQEIFKGKIIVNKSPLLLAKLMRKLWYYNADEKPYIDRIIKAQLKRFVYGE